jgi:hypothetical protein
VRGGADVVGRRRRFAVASAVPLLGGCGIQETDVIEAGAPASFQAFFDREYEMLLFFRSPGGGLSVVIRTPKFSAGLVVVADGRRDAVADHDLALKPFLAAVSSSPSVHCISPSSPEQMSS